MIPRPAPECLPQEASETLAQAIDIYTSPNRFEIWLLNQGLLEASVPSSSFAWLQG